MPLGTQSSQVAVLRSPVLEESTLVRDSSNLVFAMQKLVLANDLKLNPAREVLRRGHSFMTPGFSPFSDKLQASQ